MRSVELVKLNSDSNYIPSKWQVVEATIGSNLGGSYVWLKRVSYGVDTEDHLKQIMNEYYYNPAEFANTFPDQQRSQVQRDALRAGLVGPINEYQVATLSDVSAYSRPNLEGKPPVEIG